MAVPPRQSDATPAPDVIRQPGLSAGVEGRDVFRIVTGAPPAVMERFDRYDRLLHRWQRAINLVSKHSLDSVWTRHFLDSAQLLHLLPHAGCSVLDIGTGAGFPGLVLAMLGAGDVHLGDSDQRKCRFVTEVARETGTPVTIHPVRAEDLGAGPFDVITARACAPLDRLITLAGPLAHADTMCLFLKGRTQAGELKTGRGGRDPHCQLVPSLSDARGTIVRLEGLV